MTESQIFWVGKPKCDIDNSHPLKGVFYDAKLYSYGGQWGLVCPSCASKLEIEVGPGKGQKYRLQVNGRWLKVAG